jgi:DNA invertase Pin-like site-specific DNA recombinase
MYVLHRCDTPLCVNYEHLFLGTQSDNLNDAVAKGRVPLGSQHYRAKLTEEDVKRIRVLRGAGTPSTQLCQEYGISIQTVWRILHRKTWAWLP